MSSTDTLTKRPDAARTAARRVAINLSALQGDLSPRQRELLLAENRALREEHPAIDVDLGGTTTQTPDYTAREAAAILRLARPTGAPQDSFYDFARQALGAYPTPNGLRIPRAKLDAYRRGGSQ
jgi:hypothetical protein